MTSAKRHWAESTTWCGDGTLPGTAEGSRASQGVGWEANLAFQYSLVRHKLLRSWRAPPLAGEVAGPPMGSIRVNI